MESLCCSAYCNFFSIIDSKLLNKNNITLLPVSKQNHILNKQKGLKLIMVKGKTFIKQDISQLNNMFWSRWLYGCKNQIGTLTSNELQDLKFFIEKKSFSHTPLIQSNDFTISNIPKEFLNLFRYTQYIDTKINFGIFFLIICFLIVTAYFSLLFECAKK